MDLLGDPAGNAGNGRLPEREPIIEGVLLRNPSDQILVTAQQHPDRIFPLRAGKATLGDQRTENITEAGVAIQWEGTEFAASGEPDLNMYVLGCLGLLMKHMRRIRRWIRSVKKRECCSKT